VVQSGSVAFGPRSADNRLVTDSTPFSRENGSPYPSWVPDEMSYAGPEHLDAAFIAGFDRKQAPRSHPPLARR
jgi:hypothetical protein